MSLCALRFSRLSFLWLFCSEICAANGKLPKDWDCVFFPILPAASILSEMYLNVDVMNVA